MVRPSPQKYPQAEGHGHGRLAATHMARGQGQAATHGAGCPGQSRHLYIAGGRGQGFPHVERLLMLPMPDGLNSMQKENYTVQPLTYRDQGKGTRALKADTCSLLSY